MDLGNDFNWRFKGVYKISKVMENYWDSISWHPQQNSTISSWMDIKKKNISIMLKDVTKQGENLIHHERILSEEKWKN